MKKNYVKILGRMMTFKVVLLSAVAIIAVSCNKEDLEVTGELKGTESSVAEVNELFAGLDLQEGATLKRDRRAPAPGSESIAEVAIGAGFDELVGALMYVDDELDAGLVNLFLNGKDQYTVFAPTDEAFEGLYEFLEIDGISDLPAELVLDVLLYHVTDGRRAANSVVPPVRNRTITTLMGKTFSVNSGGEIFDIFGQTATIAIPDISASNGIIHVIDTVILPLEQ